MKMRIENLEVIPLVWGGVGFFSPRHALGEHPHRLLGLVRAALFMRRAFAFLARKVKVAFERISAILGVRILRKGRLPGQVGHSNFARLNPRRSNNTCDEWLYRIFGLILIPLGFLFARPIRFRPGDIVVLVDSTWNSERMVEALFDAQRSRQLKVGAMLHDLFPLTIPHMCHEDSVRGYSAWFERVTPRVDFFITNSNATLRALEGHLAKHPDLRRRPYRGGSFPLGASLGAQPHADATGSPIVPDLPVGCFRLLAVGTIEPRKNYACILDAFDLLRARGANVCLTIVGRRGWKCDDVIQRIKDHPLNGTRLLHLDDADDQALATAYATADCLVCASWAEGFGLPVVEGLMQGLTVVASDIEVFREVGGEACLYFPPDLPVALTDLISHLADDRAAGGPLRTSESCGQLVDWDESTSRFIERVLELASPALPSDRGEEV